MHHALFCRIARHWKIQQIAFQKQQMSSSFNQNNIHRSIVPPEFSLIICFWFSKQILPCSTQRRYFRWRHRNRCEGYQGSHGGLECKSRSGASIERRWRLFVPLVLKRIRQVVAVARSVALDFEKLLLLGDLFCRTMCFAQCVIWSPVFFVIGTRKSILNTAWHKGLRIDFVREQGGRLRSGKVHYILATHTPCIFLYEMEILCHYRMPLPSPIL